MRPLTIGLFVLVVVRLYTKASGSSTSWHDSDGYPTLLATTGKHTARPEEGTDRTPAAPRELRTPDSDASSLLNNTADDDFSTTSMNRSVISESMTEEITTGVVWEDDIGQSAVWMWHGITFSWLLVFKFISSGLGLVGNLLVIIVLFERRGHSSSADSLIGNLAVADFLTSLCLIPLPTAGRVPATMIGELYCRFIYTSFFMWMSVLLSIFTLTTISIERFFAIVFPLQFNRYRRHSYIVICILLIWTVAISANLFIAFTIHVDEDTHSCKVNFRSSRDQLIAGIASILYAFILPTSIMLTTQIIAARSLHLQAKRFGETSKGSLNLLVAKSRVLQMLFMVVVVFIICWGPNNIAYFLYNIRVLDNSYIYGTVDNVLTILAFYNSCANPIVYTIRYPQFRTAIKRLLTCGKRTNAALFEEQAADPRSNTKTEDTMDHIGISEQSGKNLDV